MSMRPRSLARTPWLWALGWLCLTLTALEPRPLVAQEDADATATEDEEYAVPENASAAELLDFIKDLRGTRPQATSRNELYSKLKQSHTAILEAAEKLLAMEDLKDSQALEAVNAKFAALSILEQLAAVTGNPQERKQLTDEAIAFATKLKDDERPEIAELASQQLLMAKASGITSMEPEKQKEVIDEIAAALDEKVSRQCFSVAMNAARSLEDTNTELAAHAYRQFAKSLRNADDAALASYAPKLEGSARRITLPGKKMEIEGQTASGEPLDWESYRGKVVLVDFWATWCGPCVAELPNVKENYKKYHERGFDVVGVNLDTNKGRMEEFLEEKKIPWVNLFSPDEATQGWDHPMATKFGVLAIPTAILVDKEGKVVTLNARGSELTRQLQKLLGPPSDEGAGEDSGTSGS